MFPLAPINLKSFTYIHRLLHLETYVSISYLLQDL